MSDIFETVTFTELREAADQEISGSTIIPVDVGGETVRIFLDQILNLIDNDDFYVIGAPIPWVKDEIPDGYLSLKGQEFDPQTYPKLGAAYPTGFLPDLRGLALVGAKDEETALLYENDGIVSHLHTMNHDHPSATTSTDSHNHTITLTGRGGNQAYTSRSASWGYDDWVGSSATATTTTDSHNHTLNVAAYYGNTGSAGNSENTIKNTKVQWIVRAI